ncbi:hypothetical protein COOONC_14804 [Cooperia oncophora]
MLEELRQNYVILSGGVIAIKPLPCKFVTKYNHRDGKLTMKMTDDVVCVQFSTNQLQDVKRLEKLSASLMRSMVSSHS